MAATLRLGPHRLPIGGTTHVMGVINLSPDSRNSHTVAGDAAAALAMAREYRRLGAAIVDLGAQSSHYENPTISPEEEVERLLPALRLLVDEGFAVSVDTWKPEVAEAALEAGAAMINDTGGLADPRMRKAVAAYGAAAVMVYVEGSNPHEVNEIEIVGDKASAIAASMEVRLRQLAAEGVDEVVVDPGIAINYRGDYEAYTRLQLEVIRSLPALRRLGRPLLVPIPRKREDHRVAAYLTLAIEAGADLIRVHDVAWACDLVRLLRGDEGILSPG